LKLIILLIFLIPQLIFSQATDIGANFGYHEKGIFELGITYISDIKDSHNGPLYIGYSLSSDIENTISRSLKAKYFIYGPVVAGVTLQYFQNTKGLAFRPSIGFAWIAYSYMIPLDEKYDSNYAKHLFSLEFVIPFNLLK
jgi:hypothetical protein